MKRQFCYEIKKGRPKSHIKRKIKDTEKRSLMSLSDRENRYKHQLYLNRSEY